MMKEKTTIPKRVKGTVLFTVVAVMMVLIVFMTATLALATTANKRAYTNYQQEQLEYNARAVLEAVEKQIDADTTGTGICKDIVSGGTGTIPVSVKLNSESTAYHTVDVNYNKTPQTRWVYELGAWHECEIYRLSVTESSATTSASATCESYIAIQTVSHDADPEEHNDASQPNGAFVSLGDTAGNEIATHGYTTGGTYLGIGRDSFSYHMGSGGDMTIDAPFYVNGDLTAPTAFTMHFTKPDDFLVVMGNYRAENTGIGTSFTGYAGTDTYDTTPYIYVDGVLDLTTSKITYGEEGHAVNIYCGSLQIGQNGFDMYGDIYMMNSGAESVIDTQGSRTHLYKWTAATLSRTDSKGTINTQYGNMFSMGSVKFMIKQATESIYIDGNVQIKENMTLTNGGNNWDMTVKGDIYVDGKLTIPANTKLICNGNVYVGELDNQGTIACGGSVNAANIITQGTITNADGTGSKGCASIDGLTPEEHTSEYQVYYTKYGEDSGNPEFVVHSGTTDRGGWYQPDEYSLDVKCREHIVTASGESISDLAKDSGWNFYELIGQSKYDNVAYSSAEDYLAATNSKYQAIKNAHSLETAVTVSSTISTYNLDNVVGREVYPNAYTREQLKENKLEQPKPADYTSVYPTDLRDDRETSADPNDPPKGIKSQSLFKDAKYQVEIYAPGGGSVSTRYPNKDGNKTAKDANSSLTAGGLENGGYYLVKGSCVLTGSYSNNFYIDGSEGKMTVFLDNFHTTGSLIVDDTHNVTLVVVGGMKEDGSGVETNDGVDIGGSGDGRAIITKSYLELMVGPEGSTTWTKTSNLKGIVNGMKNDIHVKQYQKEIDPQYPNVTIYSDHDSRIHIANQGFVTGMVMAPALTFQADQNLDLNKTLEYELPTGQVVNYGEGTSFQHPKEEYGVIKMEDIPGTKGLGLIGKLVAGSIQLPSNGDWGMIYVTTPLPDPDDPGEGEEMSASDETHGSDSEITLIRRVYGNSY